MPVPPKFGNLYQDRINNTTVQIMKMRRVAPKTKEEKAVLLAKDCFSVLPAKNWYLIPKSAPLKYDEPAGLGLNRVQSTTKTWQELLERVHAFNLAVVVHVIPSLDSIELQVSTVGLLDNSAPVVSPSDASNRSSVIR